MRLIDADRLKKVLEKNFGHTGGAAVLAQLIDAQETVEVVDSGYLCDWFINSVGYEEPVWTEEHIEELIYDFYVIPKNTEVTE